MDEPEHNKLCCQLTTPDLQRRKAQVLDMLRGKILERIEEPEGYSFRFGGTDERLDELNEFVKTERACCPFFNFQVTVGQHGGDVWLRLSGPVGVKDFIRDELGFLSS